MKNTQPSSGVPDGDRPAIKSYGELEEFIKTQIGLRTNHQLVILRCLVGHKTAHRGMIAENIAYYNRMDPSDMRVVKRFLNVPALNALIKKGVVTAETYRSKTEYMLNADLGEFQHIEIDRLVEERLTEYNRRHKIREKSFRGGGIDWGQHAHLLKEVAHGAAREKAWFWPVTYDDWPVIRNQNICASRTPPEKLKKIKHGDLIVFYLTEPGAFAGVFRVMGSWHAPSGTARTGRKEDAETAVSQVRLEPVKLGFVKAGSLKPLKIFGGARPTSKGAGQADGRRAVPAHDLKIILDNMRVHDARILDRLGGKPLRGRDRPGAAACRGICRRHIPKRPIRGHYVGGNVYCRICGVFVSYRGCNDKDGRTATLETRGIFCKCCGRRTRSMPHQRQSKEVYRERHGIRRMA